MRTVAGLAVAALSGCAALGLPATIHRTSASGRVIGSVTGGSTSAGENKLLVAGLITLGVGYAGTVLGGQLVSTFTFSDFDRKIGGDETVSKLWYPVIGAWGGLIYNETTVRSNCNASSSASDCAPITLASAGIGIGALVQTAGLVLTVAGLLEIGTAGGPPGRAPMVVVPHATNDGGGVALVGRF